MEVFYSSTPTDRKILSLNSPFPANFPAKSWNKKNPCRYNIPSFGFHKNQSFSIYLLSCHSTKFRALAHFGRPMSRRNSLRKKLIDEQKVNQISVPLNPSSDFQFLNNNFDDTESPLEKVNYDSVKESEFSNEVVADDSSVAETSSVKEPNAKRLGDSVLLSKLDSWMEQYKRDTINQDSDGNVKLVSVNEDEILRRSRVERLELEDSAEVNLKILQAESLAREMESGKNVIPRNSSVAKFVVEGEDSGFMKAIQGFSFRPEFLPKISRFGRLVLYGFIALWALKKLFTFGNKEERYSELEKEMMRRKIKSRKEKEMLEKGSVEVVQASSELPLGPFKKPSIDKQELMKAIMRENLSNGNLALQDSSTSMIVAKNTDFDDKVQEIRNMARQARDIEGREHSLVGTDRKEIQTVNDEISDETVNDELSDEILDEIEVVKQHEEEGANTLTNSLNGDCRQIKGSGDTASLEKLDCAKDGDIQTSSIPHIEVSDDRQSSNQDVRGMNIIYT
ncbi:uncharacterized protein Pyn_05743 [Prunus yedoensis var. nudiflora]|uniref:Uncharacterized protein n=1 Tax=Prunus yedoensis var. nudiflora TaxID=2094558 RepID=A0A314Y2A3_PRUYE|nr:uncharacterized protein Pyn_05743 [Prunus yedoensis var. nudiflora]